MKLSDDQLVGLSKYKYSGIDKSILSKHVLTPYWNNLVKLFPKTIAPNTITFFGLCFVFVNVATLLIMDPTYSGKVLPSWVYFSWAFGLFAYQSMDAIDGKQARRTGMAGPLGEMFDHGCDAINTTLEVCLCQAAFGMTRSWWTVASQAATLANFYLSTWEEYHTGTLYLSAFSGPVEGILLICVIYFLTGLYTPLIWSTRLIDLLPPFLRFVDTRLSLIAKGRDVKGVIAGVEGGVRGGAGLVVLGQRVMRWLEGLPVLGGSGGLRINDAFMCFAAVGVIGNVINSYHNVIVTRRKANKPILPPLLGLLPFLSHVGILVAWLNASGVEVVGSWKMLVFMGYWGMTFAYQVGHLILAHVTKSPFPYWNGMMLWSLLGALDANAPLLFGRPPMFQTTDEKTGYFVIFSAVLALGNYVRFARDVIWQITNYTGIACFTVRHKDAKGEWVENDEAEKERKTQ